MIYAAIPPLASIVFGVLAIWLALSTGAAIYGEHRGFRFWPLFISACFLGFPLVLLGVALAAGPERQRAPAADAPTRQFAKRV